MQPRMQRDPSDLAGLRAGLYCRVSLDDDGTERSVSDQEAGGRRWAEAAGVTVADVYRDSDRSASRFATRQREDFERLLADLAAGWLDLVWFWELSRSQRELRVFARLRDLCRERGVRWVIRDRVFDPASYADMMTAGMLTIVGEVESELIAERTAAARRPAPPPGGRPGASPTATAASTTRPPGASSVTSRTPTPAAGRSATARPRSCVSCTAGPPPASPSAPSSAA